MDRDDIETGPRLHEQPTEHYSKQSPFHHPHVDDGHDDTQPMDRNDRITASSGMPTICEQSSGDGSKSDSRTDASVEGLNDLYSQLLQQSTDQGKGSRPIQPSSQSPLKQPFAPPQASSSLRDDRDHPSAESGSGKLWRRPDHPGPAPPSLGALGRSKSMRVDSVGVPPRRALGTWGSIGGGHDRVADPERPPSRLAPQLSVPLPGARGRPSVHTAVPSRSPPSHVRMGRLEAWSRFLAYEGCIQVGIDSHGNQEVESAHSVQSFILLRINYIHMFSMADLLRAARGARGHPFLVRGRMVACTK